MHGERTERLSYRSLQPDDADFIVRLDADPEVRRYLLMPEPPTLADAEGFIQRALALPEPYGFWIAEDASGPIGWVHYKESRQEPGTPEIGYRLLRSAWGMGYGTEMVQAALQYGRRLGEERIVATALVDNLASIRIMEKLDMVREDYFAIAGFLAVLYGIKLGK